MLTSYWLRCPHAGCNWFGSLLPAANADAWRSATPTTNLVNFECPRCHGQWQGRVVGDDVKPLPLEKMAAASV
ncbi:MAG TPA: hypothetical protein VKU02_01545 [Gemmataceae bacterium]|nr:hypothetical protein [Gemmataceae bacterium]